MATYDEIIKYVKEAYGITVKTCWIADMKEQYGLNPNKAHNRIDDDIRTNPCPEQHKEKILEAFLYFDMLINGVK